MPQLPEKKTLRSEDRCSCKQWKEGVKVIDGIIFLAYTHSVMYTGGPFKFCPWCGKKLLDQ